VRSETDWIGEELFGNRMIRQGEWKLCHIQKTASGSGEWELLNHKTDPAETTVRSKQGSHASTVGSIRSYERRDGPFKAKD
jgi:arylsulfatase A-like enzyme